MSNEFSSVSNLRKRWNFEELDISLESAHSSIEFSQILERIIQQLTGEKFAFNTQKEFNFTKKNSNSETGRLERLAEIVSSKCLRLQISDRETDLQYLPMDIIQTIVQMGN